ncbi:MAG TPA: hypothetical protein DCR20_14880, partial [Planctomycetaceae bacterium]|nr:hypothetical protein [Planctomycetaceae bacterium]
MERLKTLSRAGVLWLVAGSALLTVQCLSVKAEEAVSVVPAWQRFRAAHLTSEQAGRLLISELNCQSCHGSYAGLTVQPRQAPILTAAAQRLNPAHVR